MSTKCKQALLKIQDLGKPTCLNNKKDEQETIGINGMQQSTSHGLQDAEWRAVSIKSSCSYKHTSKDSA